MNWDTKFSRDLKKLIAKEMYESQGDENRQLMMLSLMSQAMGFVISFAYEGKKPAVRRGVKTASVVIEAFAMEATDTFPKGTPLN